MRKIIVLVIVVIVVLLLLKPYNNSTAPDMENNTASLNEPEETANTLIPAFQESMKKDIENFKFQAEPRIAQIQEQVEKLTNDLPQDMQ